MIDVIVNGVPHQEMHVDGGAMTQAFIYPPQLNVAAVSAEYGIVRDRTAYIIRNARLDPDWASVERQTMSIAGRAIGDFDPVYMKALFMYGYALAKAGYPWHKMPPALEQAQQAGQ
jgi:hypothetical protein